MGHTVWGRGTGKSGDTSPWGWAGKGPRRGQRLWNSSRTHCRSASSSAAQQRDLEARGWRRVILQAPAPCLPPPLPVCSPLTRLSSRSWYLRHIWRLFSSSLQHRGTELLSNAGSHGHPAPTPLPTPCLREVVQGVSIGPRPHQHAVHLAVQPIQEEAQELLCILLAARQRGTAVRDPRGPAPTARPTPPAPHRQSLLVSNKAWGVSLDLRLELGGAHAVVGG